MATLRLIAMHCTRQEDWTGDDDIFIEINNQKFWSDRFDDGQSRTINKDFSFVSRAEIKVYEYDTTDDNDFLGSTEVNLNADMVGVEKKVNFSNMGASYDLWFIVYAPLPASFVNNLIAS